LRPTDIFFTASDSQRLAWGTAASARGSSLSPVHRPASACPSAQGALDLFQTGGSGILTLALHQEAVIHAGMETAAAEPSVSACFKPLSHSVC